MRKLCASDFQVTCLYFMTASLIIHESLYPRIIYVGQLSIQEQYIQAEVMHGVLGTYF